MDLPTPPLETPPLIDHILQRYHSVHRRQFPEAIRLAETVERVHQTHEQCPHGLADLLTLMGDDLEDHQQKEEVVLFPLMLQGGHPMIAGPIARMMLDHDDLAAQLESLGRLTRGFTPPAGACATWRALYAACAELDADLRAHVALENDLLFPRFARGRAA